MIEGKRPGLVIEATVSTNIPPLREPSSLAFIPPVFTDGFFAVSSLAHLSFVTLSLREAIQHGINQATPVCWRNRRHIAYPTEQLAAYDPQPNRTFKETAPLVPPSGRIRDTRPGQYVSIPMIIATNVRT